MTTARLAPEQVRTVHLAVSGERKSYGFACDRIALSEHGRIDMVSVIGASTAIKGLRGALNTAGNSGLSIHLDSAHLARPAAGPGREEQKYFNRADYLRRNEHRYRSFTHRLGYDWVHALFLAKDPDFLPSVDEDAIWRALKSSRFTTPVLRGWMPWLVGRLRREGRLAYLYGQDCRCGRLDLTTPQLDAIVADGLRAGRLRIEGEDGSCVAEEADHVAVPA
jgi:hypothetical protein